MPDLQTDRQTDGETQERRVKLTAGEKGDVNTGKSPTGAPYALRVTWKHIKKYLFFFSRGALGWKQMDFKEMLGSRQPAFWL